MTRKQQKPIKAHSRKTGKIILIAMACIIILGGMFAYLAINESEKINENEERFRLLSCDQMVQEGLKEAWQFVAYDDKGCTG